MSTMISLGHFLTFLFCVQFVLLEESKIKNLTALSYVVYFISLNHWNYPGILKMNYGTTVSLIIITLIIFESIYKKSGLISPKKVFVHRLRKIISKQSVPNYYLEEKDSEVLTISRTRSSYHLKSKSESATYQVSFPPHIYPIHKRKLWLPTLMSSQFQGRED